MHDNISWPINMQIYFALQYGPKYRALGENTKKTIEPIFYKESGFEQNWHRGLIVAVMVLNTRTRKVQKLMFTLSI